MSSSRETEEAVRVRGAAQLVLGLYLSFLVLFGVYVGRLALCEPDSSFLAALGRWIIEHGQLPATDPFSYTFAIAPANGFILHQWLTEVIFYLVIRSFGLLGLVITVAILMVIAFVIIPYQILNRTELDRVTLLTIIAISLVAVCPRARARPELFSYVLFALWLQALLVLERSDQIKVKSICLYVGGFVVSMMIWCNLHSGFMSGLALLLVWSVLSCADYLFRLRGVSMAILVTIIATPFCFAASFFNPYGLYLWRYLLRWFVSPVNLSINEMKALDWSALQTPTAYAFISLVILSLGICLRKLRQSKLIEVGLKGPALLLMAIIVGCGSKRMIPFACLLLLTSINLCLQTRKVSANGLFSVGDKPKQGLFSGVHEIVCTILGWASRWWSASSLAAVIAGAILLSIRYRIELPCETGAFHPPFRAMQFLQEHPQSGRLFNDAHFGDAMMWNMRPCPPLFLDSRFDIYDYDILYKYSNIINKFPSWQKDLNDFDIEWIFVTAKASLVPSLQSSSDWLTIYQDDDAVIFRRKNH